MRNVEREQRDDNENRNRSGDISVIDVSGRDYRGSDNQAVDGSRDVARAILVYR